ncbi:MAG: DNA polymerase III subunit delta [Bacillota bacterium]|nr:DNA polymerase III subunit delta [Bacillota bacterium]
MGVLYLSYTEYYNDYLSGAVKNIYGFYGPETFIMNSMIDLSKKKFVAEGLESVDCMDFDAKGLSYNDAKKILDHLPFGSERRIIIMRNPDFIDTEKWKKEKLDSFFELHLKSDYLLTFLIFDKLDKRKYGPKALEKVGRLVEFSKITREELLRWIAGKFQERKRSVDRETVHFIADNSLYLEKDGVDDLASLYSLIQVLCDSVSNGKVTLQEVKKHLDLKVESNVFKWRNLLLMGRAAESIRYLHALLIEKEPPIRLLSLLTGQIRDLYLYSLLKKARLDEREIAKKMGKQPFMLKDLDALLHSNLFPHLQEVTETLLDYDDMLKIGGFDGALALQDLAFKIQRIHKKEMTA